MWVLGCGVWDGVYISTRGLIFPRPKGFGISGCWVRGKGGKDLMGWGIGVENGRGKEGEGNGDVRNKHGRKIGMILRYKNKITSLSVWLKEDQICCFFFVFFT